MTAKQMKSSLLEFRIYEFFFPVWQIFEVCFVIVAFDFVFATAIWG